MKNKILDLSIFILLFFTIESVNAQLIEKKLNISANYNTANFIGKESSDDNGFIYPNLYSNLAMLNGYGAKATFKIHPLFSIGIEGNKMSGSDWSLNDNTLYEGAEVNLQSVSPVFQIHTKFKETGIFNRLKLFGEIAPVFGQSNLQLKNPVFEISSAENTEKKYTESINNYFGIKGSAGAELSISKEVGLFLTYSVQQNYISSALYNEDSFMYGQVSAGLFFRFIYNKRYAY